MPAEPPTPSKQHRGSFQRLWQGNSVDWVVRLSQQRRLLALVGLLVTAVLLVLARVHLASWPDYILIIDCGSTGTRIYAYQWDWRSGQLPLLQAVSPAAAQHKVPRRQGERTRAYKRVETEPGMHTFISDVGGVSSRALGPLLEWAMAVVPRHRWAATPVFLFGTAGLRKLPPANQALIMAAADAALAACPFRFQTGWARVIDGIDEGVYGWIALNYLEGRLATRRSAEDTASGAAAAGTPGGPLAVRAAGRAAQDTVGTFDLGGSSLEVSFVPDHDVFMPVHTKVNIMVAGVDYLLYTRVHHHYGLNDAFDRSITLLLGHPHSKSSSTGSSNDGRGDRSSRSDGSHDSSADAQQKTGAVAGPGASSMRRSSGGKPRAALESPQALGPGPSRRLLAETLQHAKALSIDRVVIGNEVDGSQRHQTALHFLDAHQGDPVLRVQRLQPLLLWLNSHQRHTAVRPGAANRRRALLASGVEPRLGDGSGRLVQLVHPCLHEGYNQTYHRLSPGLAAAEPAEVYLLGRPDWEACRKLAEAVVNASVPCEKPPCVLGASQPHTRATRFHALTGFYVVYHFYGLLPTAPLAELESRGRAFCETPWGTVKQQRGSEVHVDTYCFRVPYVAALLRGGLGVPPAQIRIGSGDVAWTLGAALAEGSKVVFPRDGLRLRRSALARLPATRLAFLAAAALCVLLWLGATTQGRAFLADHLGSAGGSGASGLSGWDSPGPPPPKGGTGGFVKIKSGGEQSAAELGVTLEARAASASILDQHSGSFSSLSRLQGNKAKRRGQGSCELAFGSTGLRIST